MPKKLERCVRKVRKQKGVKNPYAICRASLKKKKKYGIPKLSKRVGQSARLVTSVAGANIMISTAKGLR